MNEFSALKKRRIISKGKIEFENVREREWTSEEWVHKDLITFSATHNFISEL